MMGVLFFVFFWKMLALVVTGLFNLEVLRLTEEFRVSLSWFILLSLFG